MEADSNRKLVSIVMPAFNEGDGIANTLNEIDRLISKASDDYRWEVVVVDDGSRDDTLKVLKSYRPSQFELVVVELSRNFGKESALSAGLLTAKGAAVIPIDADLQDPPELILQMLTKWRQGAEVVLARRSDRASDSVMKRTTSRWFYKLMNKVSDVDLPEDVGDFRLMDRCVVDVLNSLGESRRFMKGLFAWAGFRTEVVEYVRPVRAIGTSKFKPIGLINLAVEGVTSFSTAPLRIASYAGALVALVAISFGVFVVIRTAIHGVDVPGYASMICAIAFLSGMQLLALGVVGEYVGRTYLESKRRPPFVIREVVRNSTDAKSD